MRRNKKKNYYFVSDKNLETFKPFELIKKKIVVTHG